MLKTQLELKRAKSRRGFHESNFFGDGRKMCFSESSSFTVLVYLSVGDPCYAYIYWRGSASVVDKSDRTVTKTLTVLFIKGRP